MKKLICWICCFVLTFGTFTLAGCKPEPEPQAPDLSRPADGFDPDADLDLLNITGTLIDDDFTDLDYSSAIWNVGHRKWGTGTNGGVIQENITVTKDGILAVQCNGDFYDGPFASAPGSNVTTDGSRAGGIIASKFNTGPGRYEIRLKCLPRFGSTTAFWTFWGVKDLARLNGEVVQSANQEIDIELNVRNSFTRAQFVSYETETKSTALRIDTPVVDGKNIVLNDGEWHDYKFEWHTNPERIDCYIDNIHVGTLGGVIPFASGRLTVGNWFPEGWAGNPNFEVDYTFVDYVRFTPYLNNPFVDAEVQGPASYYKPFPTTAIESTPLANLISNAQFEGKANAWNLAKSDETTNVAKIADGIGIEQSKAMKILPETMAWQEITGMHDDFELKFSTYVKLSEGAKGSVLIQFLADDNKNYGSVKIPISSLDTEYVDGEFFMKELTFNTVEGTRRVIVNLLCEEGDIIFDNMFMNLTKRIS